MFGIYLYHNLALDGLNLQSLEPATTVADNKKRLISEKRRPMSEDSTRIGSSRSQMITLKTLEEDSKMSVLLDRERV